MGSTRWSQINAALNVLILALLLIALHGSAQSREALAGIVRRMEAIELRLNKHIARVADHETDLQTVNSSE